MKPSAILTLGLILSGAMLFVGCDAKTNANTNENSASTNTSVSGNDEGKHHNVPRAKTYEELKFQVSEGDRLGVILVHRDGCPSCNIFEEEVFGTTRVQEWLEKHALLYQTRTAKEVEELFGPYGQENVEVPGIILLDRSAQRLDILKELRLKVTIDGLLERLNRALELR